MSYRKYKPFSVAAIIALIIFMGIFPYQNAHAAVSSSNFIDYTVPNCKQIPSGRDLSQLSPRELFDYGLPQKPTASERMAEWKTFLSHAKHRDCHGKMIPGINLSSDTTSLNWADNEASQNGGGVAYSYNWLSANWTLPCTNSSGAVAAWVGLQGYYNGTLKNYAEIIQAGTLSQPGNSINGAPTFALIAEVYEYSQPNNGFIFDTDFTPHCGDTIYARSDYYNYNFGNAPGCGPCGNQPVMQNIVQDVTYNVVWTTYTLRPTSNSGEVATWAVERIQNSNTGAFYTLAQFNPITFYNTNVTYTYNFATGASKNENVGQATTTYHVMQNQAGNTLAYPQPISSDGSSFSVTWLRYS